MEEIDLGYEQFLRLFRRIKIASSVNKNRDCVIKNINQFQNNSTDKCIYVIGDDRAYSDIYSATEKSIIYNNHYAITQHKDLQVEDINKNGWKSFDCSGFEKEITRNKHNR